MQGLKDKTIRELAKDCHSVEDVHEMLKGLFKDTLQRLWQHKSRVVRKLKNRA